MQLPVYQSNNKQSSKRAQNRRNESPSSRSPDNDILNGDSKLLKKFNQESDIYIRYNTQFINRKYEPLIEQVDNLSGALENVHTGKTAMQQQWDQMESTEDFRTDKKSDQKMNEKPMKLHVE